MIKGEIKGVNAPAWTHGFLEQAEKDIDLLEKIRWHFECMDAMVTVRELLLNSRHKQPTKRYGAYRRLAIMAGEAESDLRELIK